MMLAGVYKHENVPFRGGFPPLASTPSGIHWQLAWEHIWCRALRQKISGLGRVAPSWHCFSVYCNCMYSCWYFSLWEMSGSLVHWRDSFVAPIGLHVATMWSLGLLQLPSFGYQRPLWWCAHIMLTSQSKRLEGIKEVAWRHRRFRRIARSS